MKLQDEGSQCCAVKRKGGHLVTLLVYQMKVYLKHFLTGRSRSRKCWELSEALEKGKENLAVQHTRVAIEPAQQNSTALKY